MIHVFFFRTKSCLNQLTGEITRKVKRRLARLQMMRTRSQLEVGESEGNGEKMSQLPPGQN